MDGVRLDDFAELHMIEGLKDDTTIKVVEGTVYVSPWRLKKIQKVGILGIRNTPFQKAPTNQLGLSKVVACCQKS